VGVRAFRASFAELWALAWPLALVQLNNNLTGAVDTALAGRVDALTVAGTGVGASIYTAFNVVGMGAGLGLDPYVAQAMGGNQGRSARGMMWQGLWLSLLASVPLLFANVVCAWHLDLLRLAPEVQDGASAYLLGRALGIPSTCVIGVLRSYLQAARLTRPILISAVGMNLFNLVADWLLLFGDDGLLAAGLPALGVPRLGIFGLGLASGLASWVQLGVLAMAMRYVPMHGGGTFCRRLSWDWIRRIARIGLPASAQMVAEVGIFSLVAVMMGGMGAQAAAAHQAALMLASLSFSLCVGFSAATAVHVGRAIGRNAEGGARVAGLCGLVLGGGTMVLSSLMMWFCPRPLIRLMTADPDVFEAAEALLLIAGAFQVVDGIQAVAAGALRGAGSARFSFWANLIAHWGAGLPLGWALAYHAGWGPSGLWWGLTMGLAMVALALCWHFWRLSAQSADVLRCH
jgi:MATE family multidrug resistance protein